MKNRTETKFTLTLFVSAVLIGTLGLAPAKAFSQSADEMNAGINEFSIRMDNWGNDMGEWGEAFSEAINSGLPIPPLPELFIRSDSDDDNEDEDKYQGRPKFGLYLEDIDFETAYEMHYPHNYGVYISSVTLDGNADQAGIISGDIIMEFDGEKVRFEDHLLQLRDSREIGDTIDLTVFRNEKVIHVPLTFNVYERREADESHFRFEIDGDLSPGFGGGGPELFIMDFDFSGINDFLIVNGFDGLSDGQTVLYGGFGMGTVGSGWFIGGMGAGIEKQEKIKTEDGTRKYKFKTGFGGVTVTRKVAFRSERIVFDFEMLLGGGETSVEVHQSDGDYSWADKIDEFDSYSLRFKKGYLVYRPSVGLLIRLKNWIGVHGSVGYLGTYSTSEKWEDTNFKFTVQGDSPETPSGLSYTLGIWFGF
ncbi:MAG: PDZ domain-containing protein [Candidatus Neomarinimicrobiota bacterium]